MWNVDLYAPNYNGYVATITYYPTTGGTFNLGSFLMSPCTVSVDYPYGDFHLFFSAFGSTCIVSTIGVTPTPTETIPATPTMTPTPSVTIGLTPTATPTTTLTSTPTASNTPTPSITPTTTLTATPSSTPPSTTPTSTPTTTLTSTPSNTPTTTLTASPTTTSTPTSTPPSVSPTSTPTGQLFIYGKYINSSQEVGYSINGGSYIGIGDPTSECNLLTTISGLVSGDDIDFVTIGTCSIGGDTSTCPAGTSGCVYSHTFVGTTSIYLTIDASNCC